MIRLLREKKQIIGWAIVIVFVGTLFTGLILGSYGDKAPVSQNTNSAIATLGTEGIDPNLFNRNLQRVFGSVKGRIDPETQEVLFYIAFNETVRQMILLDIANEKELDISSAEKETGITQYVMMEGLRDENELKKKYKEKGVEFGLVEDFIENQLKMEKARQSLIKGITATNEEIDQFYTEAEVKHILISVKKGDVEAEKKKKIDEIYNQIKYGKITFDNAVKTYSEDTETVKKDGSLGKIRMGQTVPEFESVALTATINEVSKPVKTQFGYHIIKVVSRSEIKRPLDFNYDAEREKLLKFKQDRAVEIAVRDTLQKKELTISDPLLKAAEAKRKGDLKAAEACYQLQISQKSYDPMPHYMLGGLYAKQNEWDKAAAEYEKAKIKLSLTSVKEFPDLYLKWARVEEAKGDHGLALELYKTAVTQSLKIPDLLVVLKEDLAKINATALLSDVNQDLKGFKLVTANATQN